MNTRGVFRGKSLAKISFLPVLTLFCTFLTNFPCFPASCFLCMPITCTLAQITPANRAFPRFFTRQVAHCDITTPFEEIPFLPSAQLPAVVLRNPATSFAAGIIDTSAHLPPPNRAFSRFFRQPATHCGMSAPAKEIPSLPCAQLPAVMHRHPARMHHNPARRSRNPGGLSLITSGAPWPSSSAIFRLVRPAPPRCRKASTSC